MESNAKNLIVFIFILAIAVHHTELMSLQTNKNFTSVTNVNNARICKNGLCENYAACDSSPCYSGGTCVEGTGNYTCICPPGVTGRHCELIIIECSSSPCLNGGTCIDGSNSYTCACRELFTGPNCETVIMLNNACESQPCQNSGVCTDNINGYTCTCTYDYTGANCENEFCQFYITEGGGSIGGYISQLDEKGQVTRVTTSGSYNEAGIAVHGDLIFYVTFNSKQVWRFSADNPGTTRVSIYTAANSLYGLGISRSVERLFLDQGAVDYIQMHDYRGVLITSVTASGASGYYRQFATDEVRGVLYFAEDAGDDIYSVAFTSSGFSGAPSIIISAAAAGDYPTGLVYDPQDGKLYWILAATREIRSAVVTPPGNPEIVVRSDASSGDAWGMAMCAGNFYYTSYTVPYGVWKVSRNGTRVKVTSGGPTLGTFGITRA